MRIIYVGQFFTRIYYSKTKSHKAFSLSKKPYNSVELINAKYLSISIYDAVRRVAVIGAFLIICYIPSTCFCCIIPDSVSGPERNRNACLVNAEHKTDTLSSLQRLLQLNTKKSKEGRGGSPDEGS